MYDTSTVLYEPDENGEKSCVNIDVFVHDNAPDDDRLLKKQYKKRDVFKILHGMQKKCYNDHGKLTKKIALGVAYCFTNLFPKTYFIKKIIKNSKKYADTNTKRIGNFVDISEHMVCDKENLSSFVMLSFENEQFKAPVGYDKYLTSIYGDYMQLPPEEDRVSHHAFKAYINE